MLMAQKAINFGSLLNEAAHIETIASMIGLLMDVERLMEWELAGETEVLGEYLSQLQFVHHKYHFTGPGREPGPPRWKVRD
jgi:hypothetical protein